MWSEARIAAFLGDRDVRGLRLNDLLLDGPPRLVRGGLVGEAASHGDRAFLGPRSRQIQRQPAIGWEKFDRNPPIMAISLDLDRLPAKVSDNAQAVGKNSRGNRH